MQTNLNTILKSELEPALRDLARDNAYLRNLITRLWKAKAIFYEDKALWAEACKIANPDAFVDDDESEAA